jgi:hypothetical protein
MEPRTLDTESLLKITEENETGTKGRASGEGKSLSGSDDYMRWYNLKKCKPHAGFLDLEERENERITGERERKSGGGCGNYK